MAEVGAVREMKDCRPFGAALRGEASNRRLLRWLKTVVVSDPGKGVLDASGGDQEDVPGAPDVSGVRWRSVVNFSDGIEIGGHCRPSEMSLAATRLLARRCPACRRRDPGLRLLRGT